MGLYQGFNGDKAGEGLGKTGKMVFLCLYIIIYRKRIWK